MDTQLKYQSIIKKVLQNHADYRSTLPDGYTSQSIFDDERGQYLVLDMGWHGDQYLHTTPIHISLMGDKVWVQLPFTARQPKGFHQGDFSDGCYNLGQSIVLPHCPMTQQPPYDPHNLYPLSQMQKSLVREGKDDEYGQHREVDVAGCVMPMQQIYQRPNTTPQQIASFCEKWQFAELALFGSVLRDNFRPNGENPSDIDLLFSYLPNTNMSLLRRASMKREFGDLMGRKVDLLMAIEVIESRNLIRRKNILDSAQIIYVKE